MIDCAHRIVRFWPTIRSLIVGSICSVCRDCNRRLGPDGIWRGQCGLFSQGFGDFIDGSGSMPVDENVNDELTLDELDAVIAALLYLEKRGLSGPHEFYAVTKLRKLRAKVTK